MSLCGFEQTGERAALMPERWAQELVAGECRIVYRVEGDSARPQWAAGEEAGR